MKFYLNNIVLSGGNKNKSFNIVDFIKKSNLDDIKDNLFNNVKNDKYCNKILGKGLLGEVNYPNISKYMKVKTSSNTKIKVPIVVKKSNNNGEIHFDIIDNILYIYGYLSIFLEILILSYIKQLWLNKKSVHLPLLVGYSFCENTIIITEKHGLKNNFIKELDHIYHSTKLFHPNRDKISKFNENISTIYQLLEYIYLFYDKDKMSIKLPNDIECNIIELLDYLSISYITTIKMLYDNNIYTQDMHSKNIFIHWLNKKSYLDDQYVGDIESLYYKHNKKYIKINTFGLILKIGDVGSFIIKPRDDILILGQAADIKKHKYLLKECFINGRHIIDIMDIYFLKLPNNIFSQTIIGQIFHNKYPYNEIAWPFKYQHLHDLLSYDKILDEFNKYFVDKVDNENSLIF